MIYSDRNFFNSHNPSAGRINLLSMQSILKVSSH